MPIPIIPYGAGVLATAIPTRQFPHITAPAVLRRRAAVRKAHALQQLASTVRRLPGRSAATLQVVQAAETAVRDVTAARRALLSLEAAARSARLKRDALGHQWDHQLAALKRAAYAVGDAPDVHGALFAAVGHTGLKHRRRRRRAVPARAKPGPSPSPLPR